MTVKRGMECETLTSLSLWYPCRGILGPALHDENSLCDLCGTGFISEKKDEEVMGPTIQETWNRSPVDLT